MNDEREPATLRLLDDLLRDPSVRALIDPMVACVAALLNESPEAPLAWESVPLEIYRDKLPASIRSSWVFVLRGTSASGAERHPNSHQRVWTLARPALELAGDWDALPLEFRPLSTSIR